MNVSRETKDWFELKFRQWRDGQPRGQDDIVDFAKHVGVSRNSLNNWINRGKTPDRKSAPIIAAALGDEIYDLLDLPRPDPLLQLVIRHWGLLPDAAKKEIVETVQRAEARGTTRDGGEGLETPKRRRAPSN